MCPSHPAVHDRVVKIRAGNLPVIEGQRGLHPARLQVAQGLLDPSEVIGVRAAAVRDPVPDLPQFPNPSPPHRLADQRMAKQVPVSLQDVEQVENVQVAEQYPAVGARGGVRNPALSHFRW